MYSDKLEKLCIQNFLAGSNICSHYVEIPLVPLGLEWNIQTSLTSNFVLKWCCAHSEEVTLHDKWLEFITHTLNMIQNILVSVEISKLSHEFSILTKITKL